MMGCFLKMAAMPVVAGRVWAMGADICASSVCSDLSKQLCRLREACQSARGPFCFLNREHGFYTALLGAFYGL